MTTEKCPNPNCKDGWITDAVACCICEGKGSVRVIQKTEIGPTTFTTDQTQEGKATE